MPVDHESNRVLQKDPFGVYTASGMVRLIEQVLLPRLQHIENMFMSGDDIGFYTGYEVTDDNPNQRVYFTAIFVGHGDHSDAAG